MPALDHLALGELADPAGFTRQLAARGPFASNPQHEAFQGGALNPKQNKPTK